MSASALLAASIALAFSSSGAFAGGAAPVVSSTGDEANVARELAALRQRLDAIDQRSLQPATATTTERHEVIDAVRIEELIEKVLANRGQVNAAVTVAGPTKVSDPRVASAAVALAQQLAQAESGAASDALWQKLREMGGLDDAVSWFEQMAAAQPGSADAQTDLGAAYVQKLLQATGEQQRIELGKRIDAQFDKALELEPDHWEARFRKAVGLSYGDAVSGRQTEAIAQFERLVAQQTRTTAQPGQSQTYLYLGRLYAQRGDEKKAREVWQQGLARHPNDGELQRLLTK